MLKKNKRTSLFDIYEKYLWKQEKNFFRSNNSYSNTVKRSLFYDIAFTRPRKAIPWRQYEIFFLGTTGLKDFAFFLNDKMFHECFSIVCACMQISFNKETFKSHNQKIYITNIYLLYVAKKEREKNEDIFQVSIINQVSIKNILMFWNVLNYINCPVILKS